MTHTSRQITENLYRFYSRLAELAGYDRGLKEGVSHAWNRRGSWPAHLLGLPQELTETSPQEWARKGGPERLSAATEKGILPPFWIHERNDRFRSLLEPLGWREVRIWKGMATGGDARSPLFSSGTSFTHSGTPDSALTMRSSGEQVVADWLDLVHSELMTAVRIDPGLPLMISRDPAFLLVVAYSGRQPVGTGLSFTENGVCGLYMIATRSSERGKGIGTRVTRWLMEQGLHRGNGRFVLHATPMGEPLYRKLGFREENRFSILWKMDR